MKSRARGIIAKDDEAIFPTVRMADGSFGVGATGFTGGGGGGSRGGVSFGDINVQMSGSLGNAQQDQAHQKGAARKMKEALRALIREESLNDRRAGGLLSRMGGY
ncbi:hypothetical protein [Methylobacterium sp. Leaf88]|uniref:hypothetical protein n=1 Tax=Methylobacterium sp. Leaf88 TaxID=1736244 RepID=UPI0007141C3F|nr:hypothetical protein [Methylobacterium sp. Leaf88]KQO76326.1 hypothetical protein ASF20_13300 [Methylobacterium sp. Leaf88]